MNILTENELRMLVPSVFSTEAHSKTTAKYALIPTIECIRGLNKAGFYPVKAVESKCRNEENKPFAKHMIRFRREGTVEVGGNVPEIVMVNSHNGTSSYQIKAGIYRLVCANGLVVGNDIFARNIRHQGDVINKVVESANEIIEIVPEVLEISREWSGIKLSEEERRIFAESASLLRWNEEEINIKPEKLLIHRRNADAGTDLWTTFNVIQENMIKGGTRYYNPSSYKRGKTRGVNSVSENTRLNTALWNLTEKMSLLVRK